MLNMFHGYFGSFLHVFVLLALLLRISSQPSGSLVVTAVFRHMNIQRPGKQAAVSNLLSSTLPVAIFGDQITIKNLQLQWPSIDGQRFYFERNIEDFVSYQYLLANSTNSFHSLSLENLNILVSIEKYFMVSSALYALSALSAKSKVIPAAAAWVNIDCFPSAEHLQLAVGFPDNRKITVDSFRVIVGSVNISSSSWLVDSAIVGGTLHWNSLRQIAFQAIYESYANGIDFYRIVEDWNKAFLHRFSSLEVPKPRRPEMFINILFEKSDAICILKGKKIAIFESYIEEAFYLIFHFSHNVPVSDVGVGITCRP